MVQSGRCEVARDRTAHAEFMKRLALRVEYDGSAYLGWEMQRHGATVQGTLEAALARIAAHPVATVCAGRTDSGVHGLGQVVHFDTEVVRPVRAWTLGVNTHLPADISVSWAGEVVGGFHARFSAHRRRYRYIILNRSTRHALWARYSSCVHQSLDAGRMSDAASLLLGQHDFSAFRAAGCQARSAIRTLHEITVKRRDDFIVLEVTANAFLYHMVRNLAGSLILVGKRVVGTGTHELLQHFLRNPPCFLPVLCLDVDDLDVAIHRDL